MLNTDGDSQHGWRYACRQLLCIGKLLMSGCRRLNNQCFGITYIGLIGSATKWATFKRRLAERGFSEAECQQVTCPIGVPGIEGKEPEVIAVAVAAQLLQA